MGMDHYQLSRELIEIRKRFDEQDYNDETTREYFTGSVEQMHNFFMENPDWRNNYLFCSMGYFDNNKTNLIKYQYNKDPGCMSKHAIELMESLTQNWINKDESLSITEMFLHEKNHDQHYKALFYKLNGSELKEKLDEFIYLNLKELKWIKKGTIEQFRETDFGSYDYGAIPHEKFNKHGDKEKNPFLTLIEKPTEKDIKEFNRLISIYLEIVSTIEDECYFYFFKPHTFQNEFNCIMILGLKIEMDPNEIERWIDKAQRIEEIIAVAKIKKGITEKQQLAFKAGVSNATYNLGHFLKNRLTASKTNLYNNLENIENVSKNIEEFRATIFSAIRDVERGENIGKMLNLISLLKFEDDATVFNQLIELKKDNYSEYINTEKPFDFSIAVTSIQSYLTTKGWDIKIDGFEDITAVQIYNINGTSNEVFRPKSFFYDEILLELFLNACNHSMFDKESPKKRRLEMHYDELEKGIVLSNEISREKYEALKLNLNQSEEKWVDLFFSTGLFNYAQILKLTKTGDIRVKVRKLKSGFHFDALLKLNGLNKF